MLAFLTQTTAKDILTYITSITPCSCFGDASKKRNRLILPSMFSSRVYVIDTGTNPKAPSLSKVIEPNEMKDVTKLSVPHTTHCLGSGEIMISAMGDPDGNAKGM